MIDHLELHTADLARATAFYRETLAPLGYRLHVEGAAHGFGAAPDALDFWLKPGTPSEPRPHFAFRCASRALVDQAHGAALAAGGENRGSPSLLAHIHPRYYAAFVGDPDGHPVELVCHA